ncbi:Aspartate kinase [Candidatus Desulfarcum epimagneticum]|uniref:Aspartokinase n=1 Tax=uncultured Desulfobacteraceae bacterium TaxID=218296 RepID=A0A484HMI7_9BACT|nr:Aspartate kinase [uncultured Desulfobacteraceae bacterium]
MALFVQKYGGTSVADIQRITHVAERVLKTYKQGHDVVVVLSAMAGDTDKLLDMAREAATWRSAKRERDALVSTGEQKTVALLAMVLASMGYKACSLLGFQAGIQTDGDHGNARIMSIDTRRIEALLKERNIVVVAGFQGINPEGDITTLGRGGSDTSAVAIASALNADMCEIYTDVNGIYTADPNICRRAKKLSSISYDEMLNMSSLGAKILQIRSVAFAKKYNVPVHVRSSFSEEEGTMVVSESTNPEMEKLSVSAITHSRDEVRITLEGVPDEPGMAGKIFSELADKSISVDMIIQNTRAGEATDLTFTVSTENFDQALEMGKKVVREINAKDIFYDKNIAKVSVIGIGMKENSGVAANVFNALAKENINILMISTSEIRISCVIEEKYVELAVRILHSAFDLDEE